MISANSTVVAVQEQVSSDLGGETAILNLKNGVYYGLNPVGTRIWELIQKPIAISQIREIILEEYDVSYEQCERDIMTLLENLSAEGLIEYRDEANL
jgi:hypothetical protein